MSDNYPDYDQMDDVYYHLYLLYMRKNEPQLAENYVTRLSQKYPKSKWTTLLTDPYYKQNLRFGVQIEDSLYAATYDAFKQGRYSEVAGILASLNHASLWVPTGISSSSLEA